MSFNYNPSLNSDKDRVRFMLGDTDSKKPLFQDEELKYLLTAWTAPEQAAIAGARQLAARFSRLADTTIETVSVAHSQKARAFLDLANQLEKQYDKSASGSSGPSATGISLAAMDDVYQDTDRPQDDTIKGLFENPPFSGRRAFNPRVR